jgi:hypothetical protein
MFDRNKTTATYLPRNVSADAGSGIHPDGAFQTAVSSDGGYVFAMGQSDNAAAIFRVANPQPTLFSLQPASVAEGSGDFTLVVKGSGFVAGAGLWWDGFIRQTPSSTAARCVPRFRRLMTSGYDHDQEESFARRRRFTTSDFKVRWRPTVLDRSSQPGGVLAGATGVQVDVYGPPTVGHNGNGTARRH